MALPEPDPLADHKAKAEVAAPTAATVATAAMASFLERRIWSFSFEESDSSRKESAGFATSSPPAKATN